MTVVLIAALLLAALAYGTAPVGECKECPHCKHEKEVREREQRVLQHDADHRLIGRCKDESCPRNPTYEPEKKK